MLRPKLHIYEGSELSIKLVFFGARDLLVSERAVDRCATTAASGKDRDQVAANANEQNLSGQG